jgi:hypothetical protein
MTSIITDIKSAKSLVTYVKRDAKVYTSYIEANGVTLDTVKEHVDALADLAYPGVKADGRADKGTKSYLKHTFKAQVRNGLNRNLGKESEKSEATALITALGAKSTKEEVLAAWEAAQN